jgi:radical SAM protein (TIGR04043 family)
MHPEIDLSPAILGRSLMVELQSLGMRIEEGKTEAPSRRGGAGPSDHKAVLIDGVAAMIPIHTETAGRSPFTSSRPDANGLSILSHNGTRLGSLRFPKQPRFYALQTMDGIPYSKIAVLHAADVLATTVLQTCIRYNNRATSCQFCSIGQSLEAGRTIAHKTPEQLAEVARAAVLLDGVKHMVMTTGTPNNRDRGAAVLCDSAFAVKAAVDLPVQGQCEPPDDDAWFGRMKDAGVDALGMHIEAVTQSVRARIMPGKANVPIERYMKAFAAAAEVFGRGQVSTYILAGLGDTPEAILAMCSDLIALGVYPFVVPFVPISGTPLEHHPSPSPAMMEEILSSLGAMLKENQLHSSEIKAGCARCGACSSLSRFEV